MHFVREQSEQRRGVRTVKPAFVSYSFQPNLLPDYGKDGLSLNRVLFFAPLGIHLDLSYGTTRVQNPATKAPISLTTAPHFIQDGSRESKPRKTYFYHLRQALVRRLLTRARIPSLRALLRTARIADVPGLIGPTPFTLITKNNRQNPRQLGLKKEDGSFNYQSLF